MDFAMLILKTAKVGILTLSAKFKFPTFLLSSYSNIKTIFNKKGLRLL